MQAAAESFGAKMDTSIPRRRQSIKFIMEFLANDWQAAFFHWTPSSQAPKSQDVPRAT